MPNHCQNDLWINGNPEDIKRLLSHIGADKEPPIFDFNTIIPYPENLREMDREMDEVYKNPSLLKTYQAKWGTDNDGYSNGGYNWCCSNWGTKWNAYNVARRDYLGACITFQTAWTPPIPVIVALAKMFPKCSLSLEYFEMGIAFCGGFSCVSREDWSEEDVWDAGKITGKWEAKYNGVRGG